MHTLMEQEQFHKINQNTKKKKKKKKKTKYTYTHVVKIEQYYELKEK